MDVACENGTYSFLDAAVAAAGTSGPAGAASARAHAHSAPYQAACPSWALPG